MSKPQDCIPVSKAKVLRKNWVETRAKFIQNELNSQDVSDVLFSLDDLQQFLDYVRANTKDHKPGIRIYFAANESSLSGKATVFLAPTLGITKGSANNYDLEPLNNGLQGIPPTNY